MGGIDGGNIVRHQVYGSKSVFKPHQKAKTNADRIRAMSDEELAEVLSLLTKNDVCVNQSAVFCTGCPFDAFCSDCKEGNELEWLQQPAEEDDHD